MIDLTKGELLAAPTDVWHNVSYTVNHHKWNLLWCRFGYNIWVASKYVEM